MCTWASGILLLDDHGVLDRREAADARTVFAFGGAGTHTLDHHHLLRIERSIAEPLFQLHLGDDVLAVVAVQPYGLQRNGADGNHNTAHFFRDFRPIFLTDGDIIVADVTPQIHDFGFQDTLLHWAWRSPLR